MKVFYLVVLCSLCFALAAQTQTEEISRYLAQSGAEALIYSGKIEETYPGMNTHPYLDTDEYRRGTLKADSLLYPDVLLRLNTHTDELSILPPGQAFGIVLPSGRVAYALFPEYTLVRYPPAGKEDVRLRHALPEGYYARIHQGKYPVLRREVRYLSRETKEMKLEQVFTLQSRIYIYKDGLYHVVGSQGSLLRLLGDKRKELKRFIRREGLRFRGDRLRVIVAVVTYYESLENPL